MDLGPIFGKEPSTRYRFHAAPEFDFAEEVVATIRGDTMQLVLSPGIIGGVVRLTGTVHSDSVLGIWERSAHPLDQVYTGRFIMRRRARSAMTDSALHRSARALKLFNDAADRGS